MKTHLEHLLESIPDLAHRRILDLGSGRGSFLVDCAKRGLRAEGLELNTDYIEMTRKRAQDAGVTVSVTQGVGEKLPFADATFDFVNLCEVIEHVANPESVLDEVFRVLAPGGYVYMSVPNRFGFEDPHFDLYFVNWLPRAWSDAFISLFGKHKDYSGTTGFQRLRDMHYYTYGAIRSLSEQHGFHVFDIRTRKIEKRFSGFKRLCAMLAYRFLKISYFDSFHLLLEKPKK